MTGVTLRKSRPAILHGTVSPDVFQRDPNCLGPRRLVFEVPEENLVMKNVSKIAERGGGSWGTGITRSARLLALSLPGLASALVQTLPDLQGYLAHKKPPLPRTLK